MSKNPMIRIPQRFGTRSNAYLGRFSSLEFIQHLMAMLVSEAYRQLEAQETAATNNNACRTHNLHMNAHYLIVREAPGSFHLFEVTQPKD